MVVCWAMAVLATAQTNHLLIMKDGGQWSCQVKGVANGQLSYVLDPSATKPILTPCGNVLAFIDESLMVHTDACEAAAKPPAQSITRNCASVIGKDHVVTKCDIIRYDEGHIRVRTLQGERNILDSDVAMHLDADELGFEKVEDVKALLSDPSVVRMMNNMAQCPASPVKVAPTYVPKRHAEKLKQEVIKQREVNKTKPRKTTMVPVDTTGRGVLLVPDFDDFDSIALYKVERLKGYIGQMVNIELSELTRDDAVEGAIGLFNSPTKNLVEVSSLRPDGTSGKKSHSVEIYFNSMLRRTRAKVKVEWTNIVFASDWEMQDDSSYMATISIQQRYQREGADGRLVYSDVTNKNVEVIAKAYDKFVEGKFQKWWDVFLGDIGVTSTNK